DGSRVRGDAGSNPGGHFCFGDCPGHYHQQDLQSSAAVVGHGIVTFGWDAGGLRKPAPRETCEFYYLVLHTKVERIMRQLGQKVINFLKAEDGPTAVEYAVMLALIVVVCLVAITALGTAANKTFDTVGKAISSAS